MRSVVLGGGEMATALSLSLLANQRLCAMQLRDRTTIDGMRASNQFAAFQSQCLIGIPRRPPASSKNDGGPPLITLAHWDDAIEEPINAIFVCTPASVFRTESEMRPAGAESGADGAPSVRTVPEQIDRLMAHHKACASTPNTPTIVVCARGLAKDGETPATRIRRHVKQTLGTGHGRLVTAGGAFVAREWAQHSAAAIAAVPGDAPSVGALAFAASGGATLQDRDLLQRLFVRESVYWPVSFRGGGSVGAATDDAEAEVLGLANALALLLSFGAGLLSNEYPGSLSATTSYVAHALTAAEGLLEKLVPLTPAPISAPPPCGTGSSPDDRLGAFLASQKHTQRAAAQSPMPAAQFTMTPAIAATFVAAIANQSSREFALGRQMRVQFRHNDALRATFRSARCAHLTTLSDTMDGVHARMTAAGATSPFFESIMDAYHTFRRADDVGRQLVHLDGCNRSAETKRASDPSSLLSKMQALDKAVESGVGFEEAVANMAGAAPAT